MWVRKSDFEIKNLRDQKERQLKSLKRPLLIGSGFGLFFMIAVYFGFRGSAAGVYLFNAHNGFNSRTLLAGVFGFVFFFGLSFYHQRKGRLYLSEDEFLRCGACRELSPVNPANTCQCGGRLEPSEYFTWQD